MELGSPKIQVVKSITGLYPLGDKESKKKKDDRFLNLSHLDSYMTNIIKMLSI